MGISSVLTICVNYRNDEETVTFIRGVLRQEGDFNQKVLVVDNSVPPRVDGPLYRMPESDGRVSVRSPNGNLGYMRGAAWGLREYTRQYGLPDWVAVSNTDIEMPQPDFFSNLVKCYASAPPAILAPAIFSELSAQNLNPYMETRPSRLRMRIYQLLFRYLPVASSYHALAFAKTLLLKKYGTFRGFTYGKANVTAKARGNSVQPRRIYAPQGSFVLFNRSYFDCGGNLDHGAFLCGEEFFIAETARHLGLAVVYDPRIQVVHKEHATFSRYTSRRLLSHLRDATNYVTETFFSGSITGP